MPDSQRLCLARHNGAAGIDIKTVEKAAFASESISAESCANIRQQLISLLPIAMAAISRCERLPVLE
jgi:hypothetical protein